MPALIGYYVHHRGDGHRQRALAISGLSPDRFCLIGTGLTRGSGTPQVLGIEDDRPPPGTTVDPLTSLDCLHYAPQHHHGIRQRVAQVAEWIAQKRPSLFVVDVSVEMAMLARLASIPTVYVRLSGARNDAAHLQAFRGAHAVMAPFHPELDDPSIAAWIREKTRYFPGLAQVVTRHAPTADGILWVNGRGGSALDGNALAAAAAAAPHLAWRVIGPATQPEQCPSNLTLLGWVSNADAEIATAGVVIGSAGDGVVNAVIASGRPFICLPQPRPYAEQREKARRLGALGAAVVVEEMPSAADWPSLIRCAQDLNPAALFRLHDAEGRRKACEWLCSLAD